MAAVAVVGELLFRAKTSRSLVPGPTVPPDASTVVVGVVELVLPRAVDGARADVR